MCSILITVIGYSYVGVDGGQVFKTNVS